jgi:3-hydroxyisobutyrate dehydrogenase-like beta-hydroxyacid dehydrogenase
MTNGGEFGVISLGKMGGGLALQALEKGFRVIGLSRDGAPEELKEAGLILSRLRTSTRFASG